MHIYKQIYIFIYIYVYIYIYIFIYMWTFRLALVLAPDLQARLRTQLLGSTRGESLQINYCLGRWFLTLRGALPLLFCSAALLGE